MELIEKSDTYDAPEEPAKYPRSPDQIRRDFALIRDRRTKGQRNMGAVGMEDFPRTAFLTD
jgi:hypothetical protein